MFVGAGMAIVIWFCPGRWATKAASCALWSEVKVDSRRWSWGDGLPENCWVACIYQHYTWAVKGSQAKLIAMQMWLQTILADTSELFFAHPKMRGHHPWIMQWNMREVWNWWEEEWSQGIIVHRANPCILFLWQEYLRFWCILFGSPSSYKTFWNVHIKLPNWQNWQIKMCIPLNPQHPQHLPDLERLPQWFDHWIGDNV